MSGLPPLIQDLGLILTVGAVTTLIFKRIKQPVVLGYIIAGFFVGPHFGLIPSVVDESNISTWSEIGVIFLLFSLGLEFSFKKLAKVGGSAAITTIVAVSLMLTAGYVTGRTLGLSYMDSIFLGGIVSISSTTIIFRALDELGMKTKAFAGMVFGVLVVEDLVAILMLVLLSTIAVSDSFSGGALLLELGKLVFFLILWFVAGIFMIPTFLRRTKKMMNDETLLVVSIAMCLGMVYLAVRAGFSAPLGAFVMGSLLAETIMAERIEHLVKPVKDLFGAIFFVSVGMMLDPQVLVEQWAPVLVVTGITLIGQPLSNMTGALLAGIPLKRSVQMGMSLSQIGEFSFIIATLGITLSVTSKLLYPIAVAVSVITTFTTPYMIKAGEPVYNFLVRILPQRVVTSLDRYSTQAEYVTVISDWQQLVRSYLRNIALYGVVSIALVLLSYKFVLPLVSAADTLVEGDIPGSSSYLAGLITLVLTLPFVWAFSIRRIERPAFRHLWLNRKQLRGPLIMLEVLRVSIGLVILGLLVMLFFPTGLAFISVITFVLVAAFLFRKRLQDFYQRIESRFMGNLDQRSTQQRVQPASLVPLDLHMAELTVGNTSHMLGRTLQELALREQFGVNVARIERAETTIFLPGRHERLLPGDELIVIGTDNQLAELDKALNKPADPDHILMDEVNVGVLKFEITKRSKLIGTSIRSSGLRREGHALVLAIEKAEQRHLNPDGDTLFELADIVWVAGDKSRVKVFVREVGGELV